MVKKLPASAGDIRDMGLTLGSGSILGGGHNKPLQYSFFIIYLSKDSCSTEFCFLSNLNMNQP